MNKKKVFRVLMALVVCLPLITLSACSSKPDAKKLLMEAKKVMSEVKSFHMDLGYDLEMKASLAGGAIKAEMNLEMGMDFTNEPFAAHGDMTMKMKTVGVNEKETSEIYMVYEDDSFVQYLKNDEIWEKTAADNTRMSLSAFYDYDEKIIDQLKLKMLKDEKVKKKDAYVIEVTLDKETIKDLMKVLEDDLENLDLDNEDLKNIDLKYKIYIDKDSKHIVKASLSFGESANLLINSLLGMDYLEGLDLSFEKADIEIMFSDFNKIDEIKVPQNIIDEAALWGNYGHDIVYGDVSTQTHVWETGIVSIEGVDITVGSTTLQTLLDAGYKIDESYEKAPNGIDGNDSEYLTLIKGENEINLSVDNVTDDSIKLNQGVISYVSIGYTNQAFNLPGGIVKGSSTDDVKAAYGEANSIDSEFIESWEYSVDGDAYKSLTIYFENGVVDSFSLSVY